LDAGQALHVKDYVPQRLSGTVERRMTDAYHASSAARPQLVDNGCEIIDQRR
jgi:hypothetical protein